MPIRTGNPNWRCASTAASQAPRADPNAAHTPSPVCLNNQPPLASTAVRSTSSWAANATRIASASASQRRVEPSISVNRNVTVPDGRSAISAVSHPAAPRRLRTPDHPAQGITGTHRLATRHVFRLQLNDVCVFVRARAAWRSGRPRSGRCQRCCRPLTPCRGETRSRRRCRSRPTAVQGVSVLDLDAEDSPQRTRYFATVH